MLYTEITGLKKRKALCNSIIIWFKSQHLKRYKLNIFVEHKNLLKTDGIYASCMVCGSLSRPREFLIEIEKTLDDENYIRTLNHELVHLQQWCRGNLTIKKSKLHWNNENIEDYAYDEAPHEQEAAIMQDILYKDFIEYNCLFTE